MLPVMQTDIMLSHGSKVLIIDAKYYSHTTQSQYDIHTLHSANLYQIFTYVKTKENELKDISHEKVSVSGGELTAEVTADYLRREHLPDRAFSSEKARYHRPAGTMPEEGVVIQRRYNKSQAA
jgi:hypothetical protein